MDQGPDIKGVRDLVISVINHLYEREIRILHQPLLFFKELGISIDEILDSHARIKDLHSKRWAEENQSKADRYLLFMDNSKQVLNYAIFRWGVPLALIMYLDKKNEKEENAPTVLFRYLTGYPSAEVMSNELKDNDRFGLGKAIGDKACHLFAKWLVSSFQLYNTGKNWSDLSYEVPYDSNAGRVLWRTGYLLKLASLDDYKKWQVVNPGEGKSGKAYIRVTNMRGKSVTKYDLISTDVQDAYIDICVNYLCTHKRKPTTYEIQRLQHAFLHDLDDDNYKSAADFDEGLIHIGTTYCYNHDTPKCAACPLNSVCEGYLTNKALIDDYRT